MKSIYIEKFNVILQVEKHWVWNEVPEMTLEKLQMIPTSNMLVAHKIKVLRWWNSSNILRESLKFPAPLVLEDKLSPFLHKIFWWAGVRSLHLKSFYSLQLIILCAFRLLYLNLLLIFLLQICMY